MIIFIGTSADVARRSRPALVEHMRGHGRAKVLFGTNYPMFTPARALEGVDGLGLDDDTRARCSSPATLAAFSFC